MLVLSGKDLIGFTYLKALAKYRGDTKIGDITPSEEWQKLLLWGIELDPVDFSEN